MGTREQARVLVHSDNRSPPIYSSSDLYSCCMYLRQGVGSESLQLQEPALFWTAPQCRPVTPLPHVHFQWEDLVKKNKM